MRRAGALVALLLVAASAARAQGLAPIDPVDAVRLRVVPEPLAPGADSLTVGDPFWATVVGTGPAGWSLLPTSLVAAYAPVAEVAVLGHESAGGTLRLRLAAFRPGAMAIPTVRAAVVSPAGDTLFVPVAGDTVHVASVLAPGDTLLADLKPLWPRPGTPLWAWLLLALAVVALIALLVRRRRRRGRAGPLVRAPRRDPYAVAREEIARLAPEPPGAAERVAAAAGLGAALREYLAEAWSLPARERTTLELLPLVPEEAAGSRAALGSVLAAGDLAKFARLAPQQGVVPALAERALLALEGFERARRGEPPVVPAREAAS